MLELTYPKEVHPLIVVLNDLCYLLSTLKIISPPTSPDLVWSLWAFWDFWDLCLENPLPESPPCYLHIADKWGCVDIPSGSTTGWNVHQSDSRFRGPFLLVHTSKSTSANYSTCSVLQKQCPHWEAGRTCDNFSHTSSSFQEVSTPHHSEDGWLGQGWQGGSCLETHPKWHSHPSLWFQASFLSHVFVSSLLYSLS